MIRGLLDDPTFHGSIEKLGEEPTPYFSQLSKQSLKEDEVVEDNEDEKKEDHTIQCEAPVNIVILLFMRFLLFSRCPPLIM